MTHRPPSLGPVTALLLSIALLAAPVLAGSHGDQADDRAPTQAWQDLKAGLSQGDVDQAREAYQASLAPHAEAFPGAAQAIEEALATAGNTTPDDLAYIAASQKADKATYAMAAANLAQAAEAGDTEQAQAWFELLATKFDGADQLPETKAAVANLTEVGLDGALAIFQAEYRDLITSKVYKETQETPELLEAGEQATAVKEAAEARWYHLSNQANVTQVLGQETSDHLVGELDELIEAALANDTEAASQEATEILTSLARFALATAPAEKAQAFSAYKAVIADGDLATANATYQAAFGEAAREYAPEAHDRTLAAFGDLEAALDQDDEAEAGVQAQILKKSVLEISHTVAFHELTEAEIHEAMEHVAVLTAKFGWADQAPERVLALGHIAAKDEVTDQQLDDAKRGVAEVFLSKVREETEEVFIHWEDPAKTREKAVEGVLYYRPADGYVTDVLGASPAAELLEELEELYDATTARDRSAADQAAAEVTKLLDQVAADGGEVTELDALISNLRGKISFVGEEYRGYVEAQEAGDQQEADTELGEAKAFTQASLKKIQDNRATLDEADPQATDELVTTLEEVAELIEADAGLADVQAKVDDALALLDQIEQGTVPGTVTVNLGPPQGATAGTLEVPISLEGLPEGGVAFQARLSYDPGVLEATDVRSDLDVQADSIDTEAGTVTFNGASTGAPTGPIAVITFEVLDADAGTTQVDLEVTELTDHQGKALGVKAVEGQDINLTTASTEPGTGTAPAPGPGLAAVLAIVAMAGIALGRRDR